jgi:aspartate carbamoyltransferase catalytic subunit
VVAICGDLGMRSVRSLIELMRDDPPRELVLVPAPGREFADDLGPLASRTTVRGPGDLTGVDVVIMAGVPEGEGAARLGTEVRARHALDLGVLRTLPGDAVVLSPMPVIDEITDKARRDPRVRMLDQSELSVEVRLAVLEWIRRGGPR